MQKYSDVVLDKNGKGVRGLTVTVSTYPGGQPATIYATDGGLAVTSVNTDSTGRFAFYAANGHYSVTVSGTRVSSATYSDIVLYDPSDVKATASDYGAKGDGITNDTAAFAVLEAASTGRDFDLGGKTYAVTTIPRGNRYRNGRWAIAKSTTINGVTDNYTYYAPATADAGSAAVTSPVALARSGLSSLFASYARPDNHQGMAIDDVAGNAYILYVSSTTPEVSYIAQYAKAGGAVMATSNASSQLGHQGLALEQNQSGAIKLWGPVRYDAVNYPQGHRQAMRFTFSGNAADLANVQVYTLFGPEFAYTNNHVMVAISPDQKYAIATGRKTSRDFWVRVFLLKDLVDGGPGDYSARWLYEWNVDREILADDGGDSSLGIASAYTPMQAVACDAGAVYLLSGNSNLVPNRLHVYSLQGVRQSSSDRVSVGLTEAKAVSGGTEYEPEALLFMRPDPALPPVLCMGVQYGVHGALTTSLFAFGYKVQTPTASGTYTPTLTAVANCAALTPYICDYARVGNMGMVFGRVAAQASATGNLEFQMTMPFLSDFTSLVQAAGNVTTQVAGKTISGAVLADTSTDKLVVRLNAIDTVNNAFSFSCMYLIQ